MLHDNDPNKHHHLDYEQDRCPFISSGSLRDRLFTTTRMALTFVIICVTPSYGTTLFQDELLQDDPNEPWHISANKIQYDNQKYQYTGIGNVSITKNNKRLTADFVHFDHKTMKVEAEGHVMMTAGEDVLLGSRMEIDLKTETGIVHDGTIFLKKNHFYIKGDILKKVGKNEYTAHKASISTCDGEHPAWKITGRNLKVTVEGYGFVNHAALWAKRVPVMYSPFLVFPVKLTRQTGFLAPQIGYSDRKGEEYIQPFFWAISESSDATFYLHHMGRRGEKVGLEYRYVLDRSSKGALMFDVLDDRKVDDGKHNSSSDYGFSDDSVLRPNSDRYWFRMKHDQALPWGFSAKLDLDIVSDQDYLHEFKDGYTGYNETEAYFERNFGRGFDAYDDPVRLNRLNLNKNWMQFSLNAETRWYDDVIARRQEDTDTTLQKLPVIKFDALKQQIAKTPFYFDLESEYTHFFREDGTRGHRADSHPRIYLPYSYKRYFNIEPSFGARQTAWHIDEYDSASAQDDRTFFRDVYDMKLDLSSEIFSVYGSKSKGSNRIKHTLRPQIVYDYIPGKDQDKYPQFDSVDRIDKMNLLTYSITNTLTSRSEKPTAKKEGPREEESEESSSYSYKQFCRFKLEQSFDINKERGDDPEPFSPIYGELDFLINDFVKVDADAEWSTYESEFLSHNTGVSISDKRGDSLFVEHRFNRDYSESIYTDCLLKLSDRIFAYTEYERNLRDKKTIRSGIGFLYTAQCWSIDFGYSYENGSQFSFMINLFGIGGLGERSLIGHRIKDPFNI